MASKSIGAAQLCFWVYAGMWGALLGPMLAVYAAIDPMIVARAFFITAATFAGLSLFGYTTKKDLGPIGAFLSGAVWLQNVAFVLFAIFWLQGLAIVHWLHGRQLLPTFGVVAVYVLLPFLNVIMLMGLAVTGYIDAWFGFRRARAVN